MKFNCEFFFACRLVTLTFELVDLKQEVISRLLLIPVHIIINKNDTMKTSVIENPSREIPKESESVVSTESQHSRRSPPVPTSNAPQIWSNFFEKMGEIDRLEMRINEHVSRSRRRIHNLLEQIPSHRRTHLRLYASHSFDKFKGMWTIALEGKLLVANMDHSSASKVDREGVMSVRGAAPSNKEEGKGNGTNLSPDSQDAQPSATTSPVATSNLFPYRIGEKEEDPIATPLFTHCFEKLEVTFRTIYQPKVTPLSNSSSQSSSAKKSRRKGGDEPVAINPKLLRASDPTILLWNKSDTPDSRAFLVKYNNHFSERPPPPNMKFHSIAAKIKLYPSRPGIGSGRTQYQNQQDVNGEPLYQIAHPVLAKRFFPRHEMDEGSENDESGTKDGNQDPDPIPIENDIHVPSFLTYNEISTSIFRYIQDKKLLDPTDKSLIICDKILTEIFGIDSMNFGQLKQLLLGKNIIRRVGAPSTEASSLLSSPKMSGNNPRGRQREEPVMPVVLTYVMKEQTTSPHVPAGFEVRLDKAEKDGESAAMAKRKAAYAFPEDPDHDPTVVSFDMDVAIPSFFNYRARDLLRRVKKREFEYSTCRTKARYLLVASKGNEDIIKNKIDRAVSGQGYEVDSIPVFLALAKAAHPSSEARTAAQIDARMCDIIGRVKESSQNVDLSWEAVDAISQVAGGSKESSAICSDNNMVTEDTTCS